VSVWIVPPQQYPDNPARRVNTFGRQTPERMAGVVLRFRRNFGGEGGEGLAIRLSSSAALHQLKVTSYTQPPWRPAEVDAKLVVDPGDVGLGMAT